MPVMVKEPESKFTPAPEGLHQAVCCDVVELGQERNKFNNSMQEKVRLVWQLEMANEETGRRYEVWQKYTLSLHEKAKLRQHLESWRGRRFNPEELRGFDLERLLNVNCQIQVVQNVSDKGKTFANVQAIVPIAKNMPGIRVSEDYVRSKDRQNQERVEDPETDEETVPF